MIRACSGFSLSDNPVRSVAPSPQYATAALSLPGRHEIRCTSVRTSGPVRKRIDFSRISREGCGPCLEVEPSLYARKRGVLAARKTTRRPAPQCSSRRHQAVSSCTCIGYYARYVALAESLGCPLLTLDAKLGRASSPTYEIFVPFRL